MFCAGYLVGGIDACKGDSGGPAIAKIADRYFIFGIVSWGIGCAHKNKLGVYTNVTHYENWIRKNMHE